MHKLYFFIHPHFIIRYYLFNDIKYVVKKYHFKNTILDVGCGVKPYKNLFNEASSYVGIDFKNYSKNIGYKNEKPDIFFDKKGIFIERTRKIDILLGGIFDEYVFYIEPEITGTIKIKQLEIVKDKSQKWF